MCVMHAKEIRNKITVIFNSFLCQPGGMVDAIDSKSIVSDGVRVQVPWLVPYCNKTTFNKLFFMLYLNKEVYDGILK